MPDDRQVRIRLLGDLEVLRHDGSLVAPTEWRTGKTADLLRLLALDAGRLVRTPGVVEKLWPEASDSHARGSLRTAASRIRHATGAPCVVRQPGGLVLIAWVDVAEFVDLAARLRHTSRRAEHAEVIEIARAAEDLYRDDFHAYDDESHWARAERDHLSRLRLEVLCDAAVSAIALGRFRDAVELSGTAARVEPTSETAHRSMMRAYAELGDVSSALRVFETYRARLADEFGADPSQQTRALHVELLRGRRA